MKTKQTMNKITSQISALVWVKCPEKRPLNEEESNIFLRFWDNIFSQMDPKKLQEACGKFMLLPKVFPGDDPFAMIREMALEKFEVLETPGDILELLIDTVLTFGRNREVEALKFLRDKSLLAYATAKKFGFTSLCTSELNEFVKSQIFTIFKAEKERFEKTGTINPTPQNKGRKILVYNPFFKSDIENLKPKEIKSAVKK